MGRNFAINSLPAGVVTELRGRLIASGFTRYEDHADWLKELGYPVSRSSIHRYGKSQALVMASEAADAPGQVLIESRLRCLEIAGKVARPEAAPAELIEHAEALLKWAYKR